MTGTKMITKKLLSVLISISIIFTFSPVISFADGYTAVGTGEVRSENWVRTREYSRFRLTCERYGSDDMNDYTLSGVLVDIELENKINKWVVETLESGEHLSGVLYTAVNGYMDITVGMWVGDRYYISENAQNSVWNLKTGERITKFPTCFMKEQILSLPSKKRSVMSLKSVPKTFP
jgi:hypothetical protein